MRAFEAQTVATQSFLECHLPLRAAVSRVSASAAWIFSLWCRIRVYGSLLALTAFFRDLPLWLAAPVGSLLLAWYGSLQHEDDSRSSHLIPARQRDARRIAALLWIPYAIYRETHLRHHRHGGRHLTEVAGPDRFICRPETCQSRTHPAAHPMQRTALWPAASFWGPAVADPRLLGAG